MTTSALSHAELEMAVNGAAAPRILLQPEQRPIGLIGELVAGRWIFEKGARAHHQSVSWEMRLANGLPLNHPVNSRYFEMVRRYFTGCRNGDVTGKKLSVGVSIFKSYQLISIINFSLKKGMSSLSAISRIHEKELVHYMSRSKKIISGATGAKLTVDQVKFNLGILYELPRLFEPYGKAKSILNDGLRIIIFSSRKEYYKLARLVGYEKGTTPDAPPECVFSLLRNSIHYFTNFSDDLVHLEDLDWNALRQAEVKPQPKWTKEVAQALLSAVDERPDWLDAHGKVIKFRFAPSAGLRLRFQFCRRHLALIKLYETLMTDPTTQDAKDAKLILEVEAERIALPRGSRLWQRANSYPDILPFSGNPGRHAPWPIEFLSTDTRGRKGLRTAVSYLWTSCYIILAAFMCDRSQETLGIEANCIVHGVDGAYIRTPKFKNRNKEGGSFVLQPCPPVVVLAVETLVRLGRKVREQTNSNKLLCVKKYRGNNVPSNGALTNRLELFAKYTGSDVYGGGNSWRFSPRQLRRFFATAWVNYFEFGGNMLDLQHALDHETLGTTLRYGARIVQGTTILRQQKDLTNAVLLKVALGDLKASGPAYRHYNRFINELKITVVSEDDMANLIKRRVENKKLLLNPMPHGYCLWSKKAGRSAKCIAKSERRIDIVRPNRRKKACICGDGCPQFFRTPAFEPFWAHSKDRHQRIAANSAASPMLREAALWGVTLADRYRVEGDANEEV